MVACGAEDSGGSLWLPVAQKSVKKACGCLKCRSQMKKACGCLPYSLPVTTMMTKNSDPTKRWDRRDTMIL